VKRSPLNITPFVAIEKIKNWCAYQERSQNETRSKLLEYGLSTEEADNIITELIAENFLNEERFATAFASGKFRIKHWGRNKIKSGLKFHRVSDYCIKKALADIDENEYESTLVKVMEKKLKQTKAGDSRKKYYTVLNYMVSRGFESDLVIEQLKLILNPE
jgi:regulatory protein